MRQLPCAVVGWVLGGAMMALTVGCGDNDNGGNRTEATGGSPKGIAGSSGNAGAASGGASKGGNASVVGGSSGVGGSTAEGGGTTTAASTAGSSSTGAGGGGINTGGSPPVGGNGSVVVGSTAAGAGTGGTTGFPTGGGTATAGSAAAGGTAATGGITGTGGTSTSTTSTHPQGVIHGGAHWPAGTHDVSGTITVESGALEVDACSTIRMASGARIVVGSSGALRLVGTQTCPITVTSASGTPARGDWSNLEFRKTSDKARNALDWVIVEYGGSGSVASLSLRPGSGARITNTTVRNSADYGVMAEKGSELLAFSGNRFIDNQLNPIALAADQVSALGAGVYGPNQVEGVNVSQGYELNADATWLNLGVPYLLPDGLMLDGLDSSAHLTIAAGSTLKLGQGKSISVLLNASLTLNGTADAHVTITSAAAIPAAGDWNLIELYANPSAKPNVFSFADIMYGGRRGAGQVWMEDGAALTLTSAVFSASGTPDCDIWKGSDSVVTVISGTEPRICE